LNTSNTSISRRTTLGLLAALAVPLARADDAGPLHIIVPTPPGGTNDGVARALQQPLQKLLGRTVVVEYKPGAAGSVGSAFVARSKPDGNTLLLNNNAVLINPLISRDTGYTMADLKPLVVAAVSPLVLICNAAIPATDVKGLIDYAKQQAQPLAYASAGGVGSLGHLAMESFAREAGIKLLHVPYRGGAPALNDLIAGHIQVLFADSPPALPQVKAGKVRAIGVTTAKRIAVAPDIAPVNDTVKGFDTAPWQMLMAPHGTPTPVVERLHKEIVAYIATPEGQKKLTDMGLVPGAPTRPAELATFVASEVKAWGKIVTQAGAAGIE
jgi:tripartite-type tricarboxylate transporter receptor subunit TctC